jgi:hypothetical protein
MTDISFGITEDGRNVVYAGDEDIEVGDLSGLLAAAPDLSAAELATAVNHLASGNDFAVITDLTVYAQATRARIESEPAGQPWQEGVIRLRDHGVPDIKSLTVPSLSGGRLVFFAADRLLGAPYRVEVSLSGGLPGEADYHALPLRPLPQTAAPAANPHWVGDTTPRSALAPVEIVDVEERE